MNSLLYSFIRFFIGLFFILLGLIGIILPWSNAVRLAVIQFIQDEPLTLSLFGLSFILIGLALLTHLLMASKRHYYQVRSGDQSVTVDQSVIQQLVEAYWKERFPDRDIPCELRLKKNKIYLTADLPYLAANEQKPFLNQIKRELESHFKQLLGPQAEFNLFVSFQDEPKESTKKSI
jgi:hypothetical protein